VPLLAAAAASVLAGVLLATACKREERPFQVDAPNAEPASQTAVTDLRAGGSPTQPSSLPAPPEPRKNEYEENAWAVSEGKRLYEMFNCVGCHAHGGGDKGPALMDDKWIYGSSPQQIHATIVQGRPNGMPSFKDKIPDYQVWQITAYVRSLSGQLNPNVAPSRDDHMNTGPAPNSTPATKPVTTGTPKSAEMTQ
jgi:cytochrome c oxidase cbb3-type subunit 3